VEFVIANGAECEPMIHKDAELMKHFPAEILSGTAAMMTRSKHRRPRRRSSSSCSAISTLPALHAGCVVNNVEHGIPVTDKFVSIAGVVNQPKSFWAQSAPNCGLAFLWGGQSWPQATFQVALGERSSPTWSFYIFSSGSRLNQGRIADGEAERIQ